MNALGRINQYFLLRVYVQSFVLRLLKLLPSWMSFKGLMRVIGKESAGISQWFLGYILDINGYADAHLDKSPEFIIRLPKSRRPTRNLQSKLGALIKHRNNQTHDVYNLLMHTRDQDGFSSSTSRGKCRIFNLSAEKLLILPRDLIDGHSWICHKIFGHLPCSSKLYIFDETTSVKVTWLDVSDKCSPPRTSWTLIPQLWSAARPSETQVLLFNRIQSNAGYCFTRKSCRTDILRACQSFNQSLKQSLTQSTNQSFNYLFNQSINQSIMRSIYLLYNYRSIVRSVNQSINQPINQSRTQSIYL